MSVLATFFDSFFMFLKIFLATQSPTSKTLADFWTMIWQEQVETMVCLLPEVDFTYWPLERKEPLCISDFEITLQSLKNERVFTERICTFLNKKSNTSRVIIHLQLKVYQNNQNDLVTLANVCLGYHR